MSVRKAAALGVGIGFLIVGCGSDGPGADSAVGGRGADETGGYAPGNESNGAGVPSHAGAAAQTAGGALQDETGGRASGEGGQAVGDDAAAGGSELDEAGSAGGGGEGGRPLAGDIEIDVPPLPLGHLNDGYVGRRLRVEGAPNATFEVVGGSLPPGMRLTPRGRFVGVPRREAEVEVVVRATDEEGTTGSVRVELSVTRHRWLGRQTSREPLTASLMNTSADAAVVVATDVYDTRASSGGIEYYSGGGWTHFDLTGLDVGPSFACPDGRPFALEPGGGFYASWIPSSFTFVVAPRGSIDQAQDFGLSNWSNQQWAPDAVVGSLERADGLYLIDADSATSRPEIFAGPGCGGAAWTSGSRLAYFCGYDLYVVDADPYDNETLTRIERKPILIDTASVPWSIGVRDPYWYAENILGFPKSATSFELVTFDGTTELDHCEVTVPSGALIRKMDAVAGRYLEVVGTTDDLWLDLQTCSTFQVQSDYPSGAFYARHGVSGGADVFRLEAGPPSKLFSVDRWDKLYSSPSLALVAAPQRSSVDFYFSSGGSANLQRVTPAASTVTYSTDETWAILHTRPGGIAGPPPNSYPATVPSFVPLDGSSTVAVPAPGATAGTFGAVVAASADLIVYQAGDKLRVVDVSSSGFGTPKEIDVQPTKLILYERGFVVFEAQTVPPADNRRRLMSYDTSTGDLKQVGDDYAYAAGDLNSVVMY
jgi:hypothetical protein